MEVTADFLQKITLLTPDNMKETISEIRSKLPELTVADLKRVWKAVFYAMWHSDKYFNQQALAEQIGQMIRVFYPSKNRPNLYNYLRAMIYVLSHEWEKIDYWRINKFLLMYRNIQEEIMKLLRQSGWKQELVTQFNQIYRETLFEDNLTVSEGLCLHFIQIYLECLDKYSTSISHAQVELLLEPFLEVYFVVELEILRESDRKVLREKTLEYVFTTLPAHAKNYESFDLAQYTQKIEGLAHSKDSIKPQNRKMLYDALRVLQEGQAEQQEEHLNGHHTEEIFEQPEEQVEQQTKKKKKKVKKQIQEEEQEEPQEEAPEPVEEVLILFRDICQVVLTSNLKKKSKKEKLDSKIKPQVEEEEDIEGLDFSTLREDQLQQLREMISTIPPYLFMSAPEKRKYFANVSKNFATNIEKEKGTQCSHKRKVKFDLNRNQVKLFRKVESASRVSA